MQGALGFGGFMRAAVADQSAALRQAEVKGQQRAVLQTDRPQGRAVNLHTNHKVPKSQKYDASLY